MKKRIFGELELSILSILKQSGSGCNVRDVLQALKKEDKYTTVMTVMNRLVTKGELLRERNGQSYCYSIQTQKPRLSLFEKWRQRIFDGKSAQMISYLLESDHEITDEELNKLEKIIEAKRNGKIQ
jgi:predicted transcriptional regulator